MGQTHWCLSVCESSVYSGKWREGELHYIGGKLYLQAGLECSEFNPDFEVSRNPHVRMLDSGI